MRAAILLLILSVAALPVIPSLPAFAQERVPATTEDAPPDTLRRGDLLDYLQGEDADFYVPDIFDMDRSLADSGMAALDSLGIDAFERETYRGRSAFDFDFGLAPQLITYNRAEGAVAGLSAVLSVPVWNGVELDVQGAYAFGSEKFRHYEALGIPLSPKPGAPAVEVGFADRVVTYGSNRPVGNPVRALVGSADEQDLFHRRAGWAELSWGRSPLGEAALRYEAGRERSIPSHTTFGLFGPDRLMATNAEIDHGIDRAVAAELTLGSLVRTRRTLSLTHRVAGGDLGGDFAYNRFEAEGAVRRYLPGNFEAVLDARYVRLGGTPPVQRLADVGGLSTVRGFDRRSRVGRESLNARLEVLVPYDLFRLARIPLLRDARLQFVPWADAGQVWSGEDCGCEPGASGSLDGDRNAWLTSVGLGLQYYVGPFGEGSYLRFDVAAPIGPEHTRKILRFYLGFARGLF